jgi:hypothetical protein
MVVVRTVLERVPFYPIPSSTVDAVGDLVVVRTCECGCACIDFEEPPDLAAWNGPVAGGYGTTAAGATVNVEVYGTPEVILALRVLPLGHEDGTLPCVESIGATLPGDAA